MCVSLSLDAQNGESGSATYLDEPRLEFSVEKYVKAQDFEASGSLDVVRKTRTGEEIQGQCEGLVN